MATYTSTGRSAHHTLTANTEDIVILDKPYPYVEVSNDDTVGIIYVTIATGLADATDPTAVVAADGTLHVPPLGFRRIKDDAPITSNGAVSRLHLKSANACAYHVTGLLE